MDELAYALHMDPLELRLRNYADVDPHSGKPSGKHLRECYLKGTARFEWSKRDHEPCSMRRGHELIGWGIATKPTPAKIRRHRYSSGRNPVDGFWWRPARKKSEPETIRSCPMLSRRCRLFLWRQ